MSKGPEKQEPVTSTKNIEITLPDDERESVEVRITVDGKEVYKNDVSTEQGSFMFPSPAPASWKSASILTEVWKTVQ